MTVAGALVADFGVSIVLLSDEFCELRLCLTSITLKHAHKFALICFTADVV